MLLLLFIFRVCAGFLRNSGLFFSPHLFPLSLDMVESCHTSEIEAAADRMCWIIFVFFSLMLLAITGFIVFMVWESGSVRINSFEYFVLCVMGGVLSGLPHTMMCPLDLVKCRVQVGEYNSLMEGFLTILQQGKEEGFRYTLVLLFRGWAPTLIGYSIQGAMKFGLYEWCKFFFNALIFSEAPTHKIWLFLLSSAAAELLADIGLSPWEAVKVKMQTTYLYPPQLSIVVPRIWGTEGFSGFFKGLVPLWCRQVPYTMVKFSTFEKIVEVTYSFILVAPKSAVSSHGQLFVSLFSGCLAGALCAVVSHPADTIVSKLNQRTDNNIAGLISQIGFCGLWKGLLPRILLIGAITALQWLIYDSFKVAVGLPTTGGLKK